MTRALGEGRGHRPGRGRPPADGRLGAVARVLRAAARRTTRPTPTSAGPIPSSWPIRWKSASNRSASIGEWQAEWKWDGIRSSSSAAAARPSSGRAARSSSPSAIPSWPPSATPCPTGPSSTARSSPARTGTSCRSPCSRGGSAARPSTKSILAEVPVVLMAYDLLEHDGRRHPRPAARERRGAPGRDHRGPGARVPALAARLRLSPIVEAGSWDELAASPAGSREQRGRGPDAQAARLGLRRRPAAGRLVEVEDRARTRSTPC